MNLKFFCNQSGVFCSKLKICPGRCGLAHKYTRRMTDRFIFVLLMNALILTLLKSRCLKET